MICLKCKEEKEYEKFAKTSEGCRKEICWACCLPKEKEIKPPKLCHICKQVLGWHKQKYCKDCGYQKGRECTRMKVRIRDNFICQYCFKIHQPGTRQFDVHHLFEMKASKKFDKEEDINKLITLCHKCHTSLHYKYHQIKLKEGRGHKTMGQIPLSEFNHIPWLRPLTKLEDIVINT